MTLAGPEARALIVVEILGEEEHDNEEDIDHLVILTIVRDLVKMGA